MVMWATKSLIEELQKKQANLIDLVSSLQQSFSSVQEETIKEIQMCLQEVTSLKEESNQKIGDVYSKIEYLSESIIEVNNKINGLESQLQRLNTESNEQFEKQNEVVSNSISSLCENLATGLRSAMEDESQKTLKKYESSHMETIGQVQTCLQEIYSLKDENYQKIDGVLSKIELLNKSTITSNNKINDLENQIQKLNTESNQRFEKQNRAVGNSITSQCDKLSRDLKNAIENKSKISSKQSKEIADLINESFIKITRTTNKTSKDVINKLDNVNQQVISIDRISQSEKESLQSILDSLSALDEANRLIIARMLLKDMNI